jgi:hypothetical protein
MGRVMDDFTNIRKTQHAKTISSDIIESETPVGELDGATIRRRVRFGTTRREEIYGMHN